MNGTFQDFLDDLRAFESGWDRERYEAGIIQDWQLDAWAGGPVTAFYPQHQSWSELSQDEWDVMSYRSMNSLGFVGYQFGEALLIDLGYYDDDVFYGNGAASNTWDGSWTGKNGVDSLEEFMTEAAQEVAIREAFGFNLKIIEEGLANSGQSLEDFIGSTGTYIQNGQEVSVTLTLTGIMAAAHLRGAYGTLALLQGGAVSTDEYGTSILQYIEQFGDYEAPSVAEAIAYFEDRVTGDEGLGRPDGGSGGGGDEGDSDTGGGGSGSGSGSAGVDATTATVVVTWAWGSETVVQDFDPAKDSIFIDWISADYLEVSEVNGSVVFAVPSNNQTTTLEGVSLADLSASNFTILDATAEQEVLSLISGDSGGNDGGDPPNDDPPDDPPDDEQPDDDPPGNDQPVMTMISLTSPSRTIDDFDPSQDMIHLEPGVTGNRFEIFEESGDALGLTVRIVVTETDGTLLSTTILQGVGLADLSLANFHAAEQSTLNEITAALGIVIQDPGPNQGYDITYDNDGSNPPTTTGNTAEGGVSYRADINADDILGFRPGIDQLDFGDTSVHGMILTKTPAGEVAIDSPWSSELQIVQGVSYQELSIESFGVVGNEHLRQDLGGVVSWELGVGPREADTVYIRSHEYGQSQVIDNFDPATMKISFLYFGTRERLSVEDTNEGLVISSLPTGQSFTFTDVQLSDLAPGQVEFHFDQVMEDNLEVSFGFAQEDVTLVDRSVLLTPEAPPGQTTDGFQTRDGVMTSPDGDNDDGGTGGDDPDVGDPGGGDPGGGDPGDDDGSGSGGGDADSGGDGPDVFELTWDWGAVTSIANFDPSEDSFDFGALSAELVSISEQGGDLVIGVENNGGHRYLVEGIQAEDLSQAKVSAPDWNSVLTAPGGVYDQLTALGNDSDFFA